MLIRIIVASLLASIAIDVVSGTTGTEDVLRHEAIMPYAREHPDKFFQRFKDGESNDEKRSLLFMVLSSLGREKRLSREQFLDVVETGLADLHAPIRNQAVHSIESVYDKDDAVRWLHRVTLDKSSSVRYQGVEALARHPSPESLPYVDALLADPSITVRGRAASTLNVWFQESRFHPALDTLKAAARSDDLLRSGTAMSELATNHQVAPDVRVMNRYVEYVIAQNPPYAHSGNVQHAMNVLRKVMDQTSMAAFTAAAANSHPGIAGDAREAIRLLETRRPAAARDEPSNAVQERASSFDHGSSTAGPR